MRIGVFYGRKYYLRNFAGALAELVRREHELVLAMPDRKPRPFVLPPSLAGSSRITTTLFPYGRDDGLDQALRLIRAARDAARYEQPPLREAHANRRRAYRKLGEALGCELEPPSFELGPDELRAVETVLDALESFVPPSAPLVRFLEGSGLDAVLVLSRINFGSKETGIVAAARAAGIPAGMAVYSWDNLSSKARIHERPDRLFVWNDVMAREAVDLHGLDPRTVEAVGAPRFDEFFSLSPSASREELLGRLGLDPARRTILWLGSSGFVSKQEPEVVDRWLALRPAGLQLIVRPHPGAVGEPAWAAWRPPEDVAVPQVRRRTRDLYDLLFAADAVVALNTSAELEAAIVDRPVLTLAAGELAPGQEGSLHFRYLLSDAGGFVEHAASLEEHLSQLAATLVHDSGAARRRPFVESFLRPRGLERPAADVLADAVERVAEAGAATRSDQPGS